jgi:alpha-galactosidase/6-phospho-beta-glucosidase family protein
MVQNQVNRQKSQENQFREKLGIPKKKKQEGGQTEYWAQQEAKMNNLVTNMNEMSLINTEDQGVLNGMGIQQDPVADE